MGLHYLPRKKSDPLSSSVDGDPRRAADELCAADAAARRPQIESRLQRLKDLYGWGDMELDDYRRERDR